MNDLRRRLGDAFEGRSWEDVAGDEVLYVNDAEKLAISVFADCLRERAEVAVAAANEAGGNGNPVRYDAARYGGRSIRRARRRDRTEERR